MKKRFLAAAIVVVVVLVFWLILQGHSPAPKRCLVFTCVPASFSNGVPQTYSIVASNASDSPLLCGYLGSFKSPWFQIDYSSNGVWHESVVVSFGGGSGLILPHEIGKGSIPVPKGATRLKFGLAITSLTWRGQTAWGIMTTRYGGVLKPLTDFLFQRDLKKRSKTEWSDEYLVPSDMATNKAVDKTERPLLR